MKSVFSQKPCDTCCVYSQVGNPYNWESVCGKPIPEDAQYCNCGAKIDLEDDE